MILAHQIGKLVKVGMSIADGPRIGDPVMPDKNLDSIKQTSLRFVENPVRTADLEPTDTGRIPGRLRPFMRLSKLIINLPPMISMSAHSVPKRVLCADKAAKEQPS